MPAAYFRSYQRGSSLLDELTAVVVLSVGLLGLAGLQGRVQNIAAGAENQTIALSLAQSRLERLRGVAGDPGRAGEGYVQIAPSEETVTSVGGQHLDAPLTLRVDVARFRLQPGSATEPARYVAVENAEPFENAVPEFKRVTVAAIWTGRDGATHRFALPGIVSPGAF
jgi:hypothetical protein